MKVMTKREFLRMVRDKNEEIAKDLPEDAVMLCGTEKVFVDDVKGNCNWCGKELWLNPHNSKFRKICKECVVKENFKGSEEKLAELIGKEMQEKYLDDDTLIVVPEVVAG